jgi:hypothetical protein
MRAQITIERSRSNPSAYLVGPTALILLERVPGISEVRIEREGLTSAVLSYRWGDAGTQVAGIEAALVSQGMRLV